MAKDDFSATFTNVTNSWTGDYIASPAKYKILRAWAKVSDGPATQIALRVAKDNDPNTIRLEYTLTPDPLDSVEEQDNVHVFTKKRDAKANGAGLTWVQVKTNNSTESTVHVIIDYEIVD